MENQNEKILTTDYIFVVVMFLLLQEVLTTVEDSYDSLIGDQLEELYDGIKKDY